MAKNEVTVKKLIEAFEDSDTKVFGSFGSFMKKFAEEYKASENMQIQEEPEVFKNMRALKEIEENGSIGFIKYESWWNYPILFRMKLQTVLNPVFWGGVYFDWNKFIENENLIMSKFNDSCESIVCHHYNGSYEIIRMDDKFMSLSDRNFKKLYKDIEAITIATYTKNGEKINKVH